MVKGFSDSEVKSDTDINESKKGNAITKDNFKNNFRGWGFTFF